MLWSEMRPDEKAAAIQREIRAGAKSASRIGAALGCSRNSVISITHRRKIILPGKGQGIKRPRRLRPQPAQHMRIEKGVGQSSGGIVIGVHSRLRDRPKYETAPPLPPAEQSTTPVNGTGVLFVERNMARQCAWPLWAGKSSADKRVCGHPIVPGLSYCKHHAAVSAGGGTVSEQLAHRVAPE